MTITTPAPGADAAAELACACACGRTRFSLRARPFARFHCHCGICRTLYGRPSADVSVLRAIDLQPPPAERMRVARYRPPPALDRALCVECGTPLYGTLSLLPFGRGPRLFAFVPSANVLEPQALPAPAMHIFYDRRVADREDGLPAHSGYLRSELAVTALALRGLFAARGRVPDR